MTEEFKDLLDKLGFLNSDGRLSITTVAFVAIVIKVLTLDTLDLAAVGALLAVMLNYIHKRQKKDSKKTATPEDLVGPVKAQLDSIIERLEDTEKVAAEVKDRVSKLSLASDLVAKGRD